MSLSKSLSASKTKIPISSLWISSTFKILESNFPDEFCRKIFVGAPEAFPTTKSSIPSPLRSPTATPGPILLCSLSKIGCNLKSV